MTRWIDVYNSTYTNEMMGAPAPGVDPEEYERWEKHADEIAIIEADAWEMEGGKQAYDMLGYPIG